MAIEFFGQGVRAVLLWPVLSMLAASPAFACMAPLSEQAQIAWSDVIFAGKITEKSCSPNQAVFHVDLIWKGEKSESYILTFNRCSSVESLALDTEYFVYAAKDPDGHLRPLSASNMCAIGLSKVSSRQRSPTAEYMQASMGRAKYNLMDSRNTDQ